MSTIQTAIESAHTDHVKKLYKKLSEAIASADGDADKIAGAEARFKKGLALAADVRERALQAAGGS